MASSASSSESSLASSSSSGTFNTAEKQNQESLQRSRARTVQQRREEVSDASGGEEVAAAFKVPEPKTRGQKRKSEDAQEHHDQWWLQGVTKTDDELPETHTGDSPRAMSTRSSLAEFNADSLVEADKRKVQWAEQVHRSATHVCEAVALAMALMLFLHARLPRGVCVCECFG
jgi:hypothetical protein